VSCHHPLSHAVNEGSAAVWEKFKDRTPAEGSAVDLMARARRQGDSLKTHHMVANSYSIMLGGEGGPDRPWDGVPAWVACVGGEALDSSSCRRPGLDTPSRSLPTRPIAPDDPAPGLDTTSFTLTAMLYFLSTHPEAERAVMAEVDAFGRGRPVQFEDLEANFPFIKVGWLGG
jgi:hypothetical protein